MASIDKKADAKTKDAATTDADMDPSKRFEKVKDFVRAVAKKPGLKKKQMERLMQDHDIKDVDEPFDANGATPLIGACLFGNAPALKALLGAGARVDQASTVEGSTALMAACQYGHGNCVKVLIAAGTDVNKTRPNDGVTALMIACQDGHIDCVSPLIAANADVNKAGTKNGGTALMNACQDGHVSCAKALIAAGADVSKTRIDSGGTALGIACQNGHVNCVNVLIAAKADVNQARTDDGSTALMLACQNGHADCVSALIAAKADMNVQRHNGSTAIVLASAFKRAECVRLLIKAGAKVEASYVLGSNIVWSAVDAANEVGGGNALILNELRKICAHCKKGLKKRFFCSECYTVAYCSEVCQEAAWPEHKTDCSNRQRCDGCRWGMTADEASIVRCCTSKGTADVMAVRRYCNEGCRVLGWPKHKDACVECHGCRKSFAEDRSVLKKCAGCTTAHYCSVDCQRKAWLTGGHKAVCKKNQEAAAAAASTATKK